MNSIQGAILPMGMISLMVIMIQVLLILFDISLFDNQLYTVSVLYSVVFAYVTASGFLSVMNTCFLNSDFKNVFSIKKLVGVAEFLAVILLLIFYFDKPLSFQLKILTGIFFLEITAVLLQGFYLWIANKYKEWFICWGLGIFTSVFLTMMCLAAEMNEIVSAIFLSMDVGGAVLLLGFNRVKTEAKSGSDNISAVECLLRYKTSFVSYLLLILSFYLPNLVLWHSGWSIGVVDTYTYCPEYDVLTFWAYLSIWPVMGWQGRLDKEQLWFEVKKKAELQLIFTLAFIILGNYLLSALWLDLSYNMGSVFTLLTLGAFFAGMIHTMWGYFMDFRAEKDALIVSAVFISVNIVLGMIGFYIGEITYGFSFFVGNAVACAVTYRRLRTVCDKTFSTPI